jgi:glycosyltransferase involved in cell wall biosynthesis
MIGAIPEAYDFVRAKNLEANVEFCDPVQGESELAGFLGGINVLAHANDAGESFGLAIAEAMAAGLPVITHPAAGNRDNAQLELVEDGVTGFVAQNAEEYAVALVRLLSNPGEAKAMGKAAREKAQAQFRVQNLVKKLESIYICLLRNTPYATHGHTNARAPFQRLHQGSPPL